MTKWLKQFEQWQNARSEIDVDEVDNLLRRIFQDRLSERSGSSHRYFLKVPELVEDPKYEHGNLMIPVVGGQKVKPIYLRRAYEAARKLDLIEKAVQKGTEE